MSIVVVAAVVVVVVAAAAAVAVAAAVVVVVVIAGVDFAVVLAVGFAATALRSQESPKKVSAATHDVIS